MDYTPRTYDLLNPCKYGAGTKFRSLSYAQAQLPSASYGNDIKITLPNNECCDLSNSFITCDVKLSGIVPQVPLEFTVTPQPPLDAGVPVAINGGVFRIIFKGINLTNIFITSTRGAIITAINSVEFFKSQGYFAENGNAGTDALVFATNGIRIKVSAIGNYGRQVTENMFTFENNFHNFTAPNIYLPSSTTYILNTNFAPQTPRLEMTLPICNRLYIDFNSVTVVDINDANKLQAIVSFIHPAFDAVGYYFETAFSENGFPVPLNTSFKVKIDLSFIDLYQSILPLHVIPNSQLTINITLENPRYCLICSDSTNSGGQSYTLSNIKLKYHKLELSDSENQMLKNKLQENLIIPFKSFTSFKTNIGANETNKNIIFNPARKEYLGCVFVMISSDYYNDATNREKLTSFLRNNVDSFRLAIGSLYFPIDRLQASNQYEAFTEQIRSLCGFAELQRLQIVKDDMICLNNYSGTGFRGNDPRDRRYLPWFEGTASMKCINAIMTTDLGYSNKSQLCERMALTGVDTGALPNVILELNGMEVLENCDIIIYSYSQEYLYIKPNGQIIHVK